MNLSKINFYRQIYFLLILGIGVAYLALLFVFTREVFSGFAMQFIFLFDALWVHPQNIVHLVFRKDFVVPVISGFVWVYLLSLVVRSVFSITRQIKSTQTFIASLKVVSSKKNYLIFRTKDLAVFTVGFLSPRIYVSKKLISICTPDELTSIVYHELSHVKNLDPLRTLIVGLVSGFLPSFTGKEVLFGHYYTLVEIGCDTYSHTHHSHPTSLVSALLKIGEQSHFAYSYINHFSAQSERIKVLVGQKKQPLFSLVLANLTMITFLVVSTSFLMHTDLFYQCQHLTRCFLNLFTEDHLILNAVTDSHQCNLN